MSQTGRPRSRTTIVSSSSIGDEYNNMLTSRSNRTRQDFLNDNNNNNRTAFAALVGAGNQPNFRISSNNENNAEKNVTPFSVSDLVVGQQHPNSNGGSGNGTPTKNLQSQQLSRGSSSPSLSTQKETSDVHQQIQQQQQQSQEQINSNLASNSNTNQLNNNNNSPKRKRGLTVSASTNHAMMNSQNNFHFSNNSNNNVDDPAAAAASGMSQTFSGGNSATTFVLPSSHNNNKDTSTTSGHGRRISNIQGGHNNNNNNIPAPPQLPSPSSQFSSSTSAFSHNNNNNHNNQKKSFRNNNNNTSNIIGENNNNNNNSFRINNNSNNNPRTGFITSKNNNSNTNTNCYYYPSSPLQEVPSTVLHSLRPLTREQDPSIPEFYKASVVERQIQNVKSVSCTATQTEFVPLRSTGQNHDEGGWPASIESMMQTNESSFGEESGKYLKRILREDKYCTQLGSCVSRLMSGMRCNAAVEIYSMAFSDYHDETQQRQKEMMESYHRSNANDGNNNNKDSKNSSSKGSGGGSSGGNQKNTTTSSSTAITAKDPLQEAQVRIAESPISIPKYLSLVTSSPCDIPPPFSDCLITSIAWCPGTAQVAALAFEPSQKLYSNFSQVVVGSSGGGGGGGAYLGSNAGEGGAETLYVPLALVIDVDAAKRELRQNSNTTSSSNNFSSTTTANMQNSTNNNDFANVSLNSLAGNNNVNVNNDQNDNNNNNNKSHTILCAPIQSGMITSISFGLKNGNAYIIAGTSSGGVVMWDYRDRDGSSLKKMKEEKIKEFMAAGRRHNSNKDNNSNNTSISGVGGGGGFLNSSQSLSTHNHNNNNVQNSSPNFLHHHHQQRNTHMAMSMTIAPSSSLPFLQQNNNNNNQNQQSQRSLALLDQMSNSWIAPCCSAIPPHVSAHRASVISIRAIPGRVVHEEFVSVGSDGALMQWDARYVNSGPQTNSALSSVNNHSSNGSNSKTLVFGKKSGQREKRVDLNDSGEGSGDDGVDENYGEGDRGDDDDEDDDELLKDPFLFPQKIGLQQQQQQQQTRHQTKPNSSALLMPDDSQIDEKIAEKMKRVSTLRFDVAGQDPQQEQKDRKATDSPLVPTTTQNNNNNNNNNSNPSDKNLQTPPTPNHPKTSSFLAVPQQHHHPLTPPVIQNIRTEVSGFDENYDDDDDEEEEEEEFDEEAFLHQRYATEVVSIDKEIFPSCVEFEPNVGGATRVVIADAEGCIRVISRLQNVAAAATTHNGNNLKMMNINNSNSNNNNNNILTPSLSFTPVTGGSKGNIFLPSSSTPPTPKNKKRSTSFIPVAAAALVKSPSGLTPKLSNVVANEAISGKKPSPCQNAKHLNMNGSSSDKDSKPVKILTPSYSAIRLFATNQKKLQKQQQSQDNNNNNNNAPLSIELTSSMESVQFGSLQSVMRSPHVPKFSVAISSVDSTSGFCVLAEEARVLLRVGFGGIDSFDRVISLQQQHGGDVQQQQQTQKHQSQQSGVGGSENNNLNTSGDGDGGNSNNNNNNIIIKARKQNQLFPEFEHNRLSPSKSMRRNRSRSPGHNNNKKKGFGKSFTSNSTMMMAMSSEGSFGSASFRLNHQNNFNSNGDFGAMNNNNNSNNNVDQRQPAQQSAIGITCLSWHPLHSSLLFGGTSSGDLIAWDLCRSFTEPIWVMKNLFPANAIVENIHIHSQGEIAFVSGSIDLIVTSTATTTVTTAAPSHHQNNLHHHHHGRTPSQNNNHNANSSFLRTSSFHSNHNNSYHGSPLSTTTNHSPSFLSPDQQQLPLNNHDNSCFPSNAVGASSASFVTTTTIVKKGLVAFVRFPSLEEMIFRSTTTTPFPVANNNSAQFLSSLFSSPQIASRRRADLQAQRTVLVHVLDHNLHVAKTKMQKENLIRQQQVQLLLAKKQLREEERQKQKEEESRRKINDDDFFNASVSSQQSVAALASTIPGNNNINNNNESKPRKKNQRLTSFVLDSGSSGSHQKQQQQQQQQLQSKQKLDQKENHKNDHDDDVKNNNNISIKPATIVISTSNLAQMKSLPGNIVESAVDLANEYLISIGLSIHEAEGHKTNLVNDYRHGHDDDDAAIKTSKKFHNKNGNDDDDDDAEDEQNEGRIFVKKSDNEFEEL